MLITVYTVLNNNHQVQNCQELTHEAYNHEGDDETSQIRTPLCNGQNLGSPMVSVLQDYLGFCVL